MKRIIYSLICLAMLLSCAASAIAAPQRRASVDSLAFEAEMHHAMRELGMVGVSVAVVRDNAIVYNGSFGYSDIESWSPLSNDNLFRIASISKSFVATAVMTLIDDRKLSLNTPIGDILDFPVVNPKFPDTPITIEMMLAHTSSINDSEGYYISYDCIRPDRNPNWQNCYNDYRPGSGYEYCNLNYNLLGIVIEKLSGERFDHYIARHILEPLDIEGSFCFNSVDSTRCASLYSWQSGVFVHRPEAYRLVPDLDSYVPGVSTVRLSPAGGMKITALDLAKYMLMHINYGKSPLSSQRVMSKRSAKAMQAVHTPGDVTYGLALERSDDYVPGLTLTGHTGGAYGLRSAMFFDPEQKFGFVVICNGAKSDLLVSVPSLLYNHFIKPIK